MWFGKQELGNMQVKECTDNWWFGELYQRKQLQDDNILLETIILVY